MASESAHSFEVVIKITERCNINCSYCYMFNLGNNDYLNHPPYISTEVIEDIATFLLDGIHALSAKRVGIVFHGGEPLMLKKQRFIDMCETLTQRITPHAKLDLSIQTNAMLIDDGWIAIFEKFKIGIGVSLDGPADYHDIARVDHQNRGTHAATVQGIRQLQDAYNAQRIGRPGAICVINPKFSARKIYRHFVDELGLRLLSFNFPMETNDSISPATVALTTTFITELFEEWVNDDNPEIKIRLFDSMFSFFSGSKASQNIAPDFSTRHILVVIASNGDISENDDFKMIQFGQNFGNVHNTSMAEFVNSPLRQYICQISHRLPAECLACDWQNYCLAGGSHGLTVSRFSKTRGFDNPSSMCETFKVLFELGATYLLRNGVSIDVLKASLDHTPYKELRSTHLPLPPPGLFTRIIPVISQ